MAVGAYYSRCHGRRWGLHAVVIQLPTARDHLARVPYQLSGERRSEGGREGGREGEACKLICVCLSP